MARYQREDILGLDLNNGPVVCIECATEEEWNNAKEEEIILETSDDEVIFCDRCREKL